MAFAGTGSNYPVPAFWLFWYHWCQMVPGGGREMNEPLALIIRGKSEPILNSDCSLELYMGNRSDSGVLSMADFRAGYGKSNGSLARF